MRTRTGGAAVAALALLAVPVAASVRPGPDRHRRPLERVVRDWQAAQAAPGVSVAWAGPDGRVHTLAAGEAEPGGQAMSPAHTVHVGSITKLVVAATVLRLAERGVLELDDPLGRWLGEPARFRDVTVRQAAGPHGRRTRLHRRHGLVPPARSPLDHRRASGADRGAAADVPAR